MKYLLPLLFLFGCSNKVEVPKKVEHSGKVEHVITIELKVPEVVLSDCNNLPSEEEEVNCIENKKQEYLDNIFALLSQFNSDKQ